MAEATDETARVGRGLALRALVAAAAVVAYLLVRGGLEARALVTARFGIGVVLFALLVDVGRSLVGVHDPLEGDLRPHHQRAEPLVDDRYERVHEPVKRFVDEGVWTSSYESVLEEVFESEDVPRAERRRVIEQARQAAASERPAGPPILGGLASGIVVTFGLALAVGILLEAVGVPVLGPVLLVAGVALAVMQLRAHDGGARWLALGLGVAGAGTVALAALRLSIGFPGPWWVLLGFAVVMALASAALAILGDATPPAWSTVEDRLEDRLVTLRRAFLGTLLAGGVLFPFEPLLAEAFAAMAWPFEVPYRVATIGYGTLAAYLAVEMAVTWYGLSQGRERARDQRERRVEANAAILDLLDEHAPRQALGGRRS